MTRLRLADLEAILDFLGAAGALEFEEPYPTEFLSELQDLVACDVVTYAELDRAQHTFFARAEVPANSADDEAAYWRVVDTCPIFKYRDCTGDLSAVRVSDLIGRRRYHELPIYCDYFRCVGLDCYLELGLRTRPGRDRFFALFRRVSARDFSQRDREVLEALRPHLRGFEAHAAVQRRLAEMQRGADPRLEADLTPREREIVELVGQGKTNAEIASILWVAPSTVKKHLEHVYEKIGVGRRAAAVAGISRVSLDQLGESPQAQPSSRSGSSVRRGRTTWQRPRGDARRRRRTPNARG